MRVLAKKTRAVTHLLHVRLVVRGILLVPVPGRVHLDSVRLARLQLSAVRDEDLLQRAVVLDGALRVKRGAISFRGETSASRSAAPSPSSGPWTVRR